MIITANNEPINYLSIPSNKSNIPKGESTDIAITIEYDENNIPTRDTIQAYSKELDRRLKLLWCK